MCCCFGFLLGRKIFLHESPSVSTNASYSLLWRHFSASLFSLVWWNSAGHSQEKVRGAAKEPESCPPSQAGWLEQTHCCLMTVRSKSEKLFSSLDAVFYAGACSPAVSPVLLPVPLPLVLFEHFLAQEQDFLFLQHQAQQLPNLSEKVRCLVQCW